MHKRHLYDSLIIGMELIKLIFLLKEVNEPSLTNFRPSIFRDVEKE